MKFRTLILAATLSVLAAVPAAAQPPSPGSATASASQGPPSPASATASASQGPPSPGSATASASQGPPAPVPSLPAPGSQAPSATQAGKPQPTGTMAFCGYTIGPPAKLPPAGSGPVLYQYALCFERQGGTSGIDPQTCIYYF